MTETSEHHEPRLASDNLILGVVAAYAAAFVVFGFLVQPAADVLRGLGAILTTRDALLTDYFGVGGIGGGCVSAGLLTLAGALVYWRAGAKMTGASVAALFLVLGFGLFGKNLLNVWPIEATTPRTPASSTCGTPATAEPHAIAARKRIPVRGLS
jgi:Protein of unknown function (DUF1576)